MFYDLGLNLEVKTVDLSTLLSVAGSDEAEMLSVQYTYAPADPYTDMSWMLSEYGWTHYVNEEVSAALLESQGMSDMDAVREKYLFVNRQVREDWISFLRHFFSSLSCVFSSIIMLRLSSSSRSIA